jgi:hypothetical protein
VIDDLKKCRGKLHLFPLKEDIKYYIKVKNSYEEKIFIIFVIYNIFSLCHYICNGSEICRPFWISNGWDFNFALYIYFLII